MATRMVHPFLAGERLVEDEYVEPHRNAGWEVAPEPQLVEVDAPVRDVLDEVGDDPSKAAAALAAEEEARPDPRKTLTEPLRRIAKADTEES